MAAGDVVVFNESMAYMLDGGWEAADTIKIAICDNTAAPTQTTTTPTLADFTEVGSAGSYTAGGETLDTWGNMVTQSGATLTFDDTGASVSWTQNASNDIDAYWGIIYNSTQTIPVANPCIAYVDLGGPVDMSAGALTITWNASGIFTITN